MRAKVVVEKSFDETRELSKEWSVGDFEQFFEEEGEYLDRLSKALGDNGHNGEKFVVIYTVTVTK